jgi:hypothetical protein
MTKAVEACSTSNKQFIMYDIDIICIDDYFNTC